METITRKFVAPVSKKQIGSGFLFAIIFFLAPYFALADTLFTPTFVTSAAATNITIADTSKYYVMYTVDTGTSDEGRINPGESGFPLNHWFNHYADGAHVMVKMSDSGASSGSSCGYGTGMSLSSCRAAGNYVSEQVFCVGSTAECDAPVVTTPPPNGLGAAFLLTLMWWFVLITEALLLFVPIYLFVRAIRYLFEPR